MLQKILLLLLFVTTGYWSSTAQTIAQLKAYAASFPPMPSSAFQLNAYIPAPYSATISAGSPCSDLEWTVFDSDYIDGETDGYDIFCPVDPSRSFPGADNVKLIEGVSKLHSSELYDGAKGCRVILGSADKPFPYFYRGADNVDNDFLVLQHFDYRNGHIQLRGSAADYRLLYADTQTDSVQTTGWYLFYTADGSIDLLAFIHACDDPTSDQIPSYQAAYCNTSQQLSLTNPVQFRYATAVGSLPAYAGSLAQVGGAGREVVSGLAVDPFGNSYLFGATDSDLEPSATGLNELFVSKTRPDGSLAWVYELPVSEASLLFDAVADSQFLYAAGRTYGNLAGFQNQGKWDGILLKLDLNTGTLVDWEQFGTSAIDGFGNIVLDDAGYLYVSGAGAPPNNTTPGDSAFLVAKYDCQTLQQQWLATEPVLPNSQKVAEAWGGLSYIPSASPGDGKLVVAGWFINTQGNGADAFVALYDNLNGSLPNRLNTQVISSPGFKADWVWGNAVDQAGNIFVAGYTSGNLQGAAAGKGDAFIIKYDPQLDNPIYRQVGSTENERFRGIAINDQNQVYVSGYTYGNWATANRDTALLSADIILQKYDNNLQLLGSSQLGTPQEERGFVVYSNQRLYVGGMTEGAMTAPNAGSFDGFVLTVDTNSLQPFDPLLALNHLPTPVTNLEVYPNPSTGMVFLKGYTATTAHQVLVYDALGRLVQQHDSWQPSLDLSAVEAGVYQIVVQTATSVVARTVVLQ